MTSSVLNTKIIEVENKTPNNSGLVSKTGLNAKGSEVENKIPGNSEYISTHEFKTLTAKHFVAKLKQADLVNRTDFDY